MIAPPPPPTAWHFDDGRGGALCGYAGAERITPPLHAGGRMFASRAGCCPDCWQEFWTGRLERPHYWYEEQDAMPTTKRKQRKQRAKKQVGSAVRTTADAADTDGGDGEVLRGKYGLNQFGVYTSPEVVEISIAKGHRSKIVMQLAEDDDGGWHWGVDLAMPDSGHGFLPSLDTKAYPSRAHALEMALMHAAAWLVDQIDRADTKPAARKAAVAATKAIEAMLGKVRAGLNSGRGGRHAVEAQEQPPVPPGVTSTTTPAGIAAIDPAAVQADNAIWRVPLDLLDRHPANRHPSPEAIAACAASLEATGQLEPIVVRLLASGRLQIISGETRFLAAQQLGWEAIAARVLAFPQDGEALRLVAEYNSHRSDLNAIERARLIEQLCRPADEGGGGLTREQAARSVGLESASAASNLVRLLELPDIWQDRVAAGLLPQTYARVLLSVAATEPTVWHHAEEVWHTWQTRGDVDRFAAFMQGRLPSDLGHDDSDDEAEPDDNEPFPEKVVGSDPATTEPATDAASAAADTAADDEDGSGDVEDLTAADGEAVPDDDEPASVASEEPVQISERLRGAVEEWRTMWLSQLVHDALPDAPDAVDRLYTWMLCGISPGVVMGDVWRGLAEVGSYATPLDCWRAVANHSDEWVAKFKLQVCLAVLPGSSYVDVATNHSVSLASTVLDDLAHLMGLDIKVCWRRLCEDDPRCMLPAFLKLHTLGELADLGNMVSVDVAGLGGKQARAHALMAQPIPVPPYLRDWSAA